MATAIEKINQILALTVGGVVDSSMEVLPHQSDLGSSVAFVKNGGNIVDYVEKYERFNLRTEDQSFFSNIVKDSIDLSVDGLMIFDLDHDVGNSIMVSGSPIRNINNYGDDKGHFIRRIYLNIYKVMAVEFTYFKAI